MQTSTEAGSSDLLLALLAAPPRARRRRRTAYVTNEKGNSITVIDLDKLEVVKTVKVGQRPRGIALSQGRAKLFVCLGDDDTIPILDTKTLKAVGDLPSGPDPEQLRLSPDGKLVFVANENDALLTAIDIATRKAISEFPVGVEPEGVAVSPDGAIVVNTSETTSMAHFIDWQTQEDRRQRARRLAAALCRVQAGRRGTLGLLGGRRRRSASSIRSSTPSRSKITFDVPGLPKEQIQPVGIRFSARRQARLRRARPRQSRRRHRCRDARRC